MVAVSRFAEPPGSSDAPVRPVLDVVNSACGRIWVDRLGPHLQPVAQAIAQRCGLPDIVARVLAGRGVDAEGAAAHLDPSLKRLMPDPSVLTDMDAAAGRLADAVERGESVAIFGDYDVDGATSSALLGRMLRSLGRSPTLRRAA